MEDYTFLAFGGAQTGTKTNLESGSAPDVDIDINNKNPVIETAVESLGNAWDTTKDVAESAWEGTKNAVSGVANFGQSALTKLIIIMVLVLIGYFLLRKEIDKL